MGREVNCDRKVGGGCALQCARARGKMSDFANNFGQCIAKCAHSTFLEHSAGTTQDRPS